MPNGVDSSGAKVLLRDKRDLRLIQSSYRGLREGRNH